MANHWKCIMQIICPLLTLPVINSFPSVCFKPLWGWNQMSCAEWSVIYYFFLKKRSKIALLTDEIVLLPRLKLQPICAYCAIPLKYYREVTQLQRRVTLH